MPRAILIHAESLEKIAEVNSGVRPSLEPGTENTWYVDMEDAGEYNEILTSRKFNEKYRVPQFPVPLWAYFVPVYKK